MPLPESLVKQLKALPLPPPVFLSARLPLTLFSSKIPTTQLSFYISVDPSRLPYGEDDDVHGMLGGEGGSSPYMGALPPIPQSGVWPPEDCGLLPVDTTTLADIVGSAPKRSIVQVAVDSVTVLSRPKDSSASASAPNSTPTTAAANGSNSKKKTTKPHFELAVVLRLDFVERENNQRQLVPRLTQLQPESHSHQLLQVNDNQQQYHYQQQQQQQHPLLGIHQPLSVHSNSALRISTTETNNNNDDTLRSPAALHETSATAEDNKTAAHALADTLDQVLGSSGPDLSIGLQPLSALLNSVLAPQDLLHQQQQMSKTPHLASTRAGASAAAAATEAAMKAALDRSRARSVDATTYSVKHNDSAVHVTPVPPPPMPPIPQNMPQVTQWSHQHSQHQLQHQLQHHNTAPSRMAGGGATPNIDSQYSSASFSRTPVMFADSPYPPQPPQVPLPASPINTGLHNHYHAQAVGSIPTDCGPNESIPYGTSTNETHISSTQQQQQQQQHIQQQQPLAVSPIIIHANTTSTPTPSIPAIVRRSVSSPPSPQASRQDLMSSTTTATTTTTTATATATAAMATMSASPAMIGARTVASAVQGQSGTSSSPRHTPQQQQQQQPSKPTGPAASILSGFRRKQKQPQNQQQSQMPPPIMTNGLHLAAGPTGTTSDQSMILQSPGGVNSIASNNDSMVIANSPIIGGKSSISSFQESFVLVDHPGHNINNSAATAAAAHGGSWRLYNVDGQQQRPAGVRASTQLSHNSVNSEHDNNAGSGRRRFQRSATTKPLPALPSSLSSSALDQHQYSSNSYSGSGSGGGGGTSPRMATSKAYVNGNGTVPAATSAIAQSRPLSALKFSRLMAALPDFHTNNSGGGSKSRGELNNNIRPASTSRVPAAGGASPIFNSLDDQIADLIRSPINATHDVSGLPRNYSSGSLLHTQSGVNGGHAATLSASHQLDTESMSKMPLRYHVISEMVDTEAKFAENMSLVYTEWLEPVMNSIQAANEKPIMDLDDARIIFGEIENLRDHSMAMYWDLQMMLDLTLWNSIHNIDEQQQSQLDAVDSSIDLDGQQPPQHDGARVGCIFFDPKRDWDIFTRYVLGYNSALQAVERAERGKQFQRHEKEVLDSRRTNRHLLRDLLMQPIQRIMRYSLLLRALLKNTSEEHADYDDLQTAMAQMTSLTEHLNNLRKMQEDMAERDLIANSIMNCPQLVRRMSRRLVSDAYLMQLIGTKRQRVRVLVFSDVLVVAHSFNSLVNRAAWTMSLSLNRTNSGNTSAGGSSSMVLLSPASTLTAAALASSPVSSATMSNGNNNGNGEKQRWKHVYTFDLRLISILPFAAKDNKFSITVSGSEDYSALEHSTNWPATSLSAISLASAPPPSTLPNSSSITKLIQPLSHHQSQSQPLPSFTSMASSTKTSSGGPSRSDSTGSAHTSGSNRSTQIVWMSPTANISTNNSSTSPPPPAALPLPQAPPPSAPLAPTSVHIPRRSSSTMSGSKSMSSTMLPLLPPLDTSSAALAPTDADGGAPTSPMSIVPIVHYGGNSREYSHGEPDSLSSSANGAGGATATVAGVLANGSKTIDLHFQCADESARNDLVAQIRTAIYEARLQ